MGPLITKSWFYMKEPVGVLKLTTHHVQLQVVFQSGLNISEEEKQGFCILMSFAYIDVCILFCTLEYFIVIKEVYFLCEI